MNYEDLESEQFGKNRAPNAKVKQFKAKNFDKLYVIERKCTQKSERKSYIIYDFLSDFCDCDCDCDFCWTRN